MDYKTDRSRRAHDEYRKQVSVYYHVLAEWFDDRTVSTNLFYTADGDIQSIQPFSAEDLESIIREVAHDRQ